MDRAEGALLVAEKALEAVRQLDVTVESLRSEFGRSVADTISQEVAKAVAAIPVPKDGRDGKDGAPGDDGAAGRAGASGPAGEPGEPGERGSDGQDGAQGLAGVDGERGATGDPGKDGAPGATGERGETGIHGKDGALGSTGAKGESGDPGEPGPAGKDGAPGLEGRDGRDGNDGLRGEKGEPGRDGAAGAPGIDGKSVTLAEVSHFFGGEVAKWALEFEHRALEAHQRALDRMSKPKDGRDGKDGVSIDDISLGLKNGRTVVLTLRAGEHEITREQELEGLPIYRGTYKAGARNAKGDARTWGGSIWMATKDTDEPPKGPSDAWVLIVKGGK